MTAFANARKFFDSCERPEGWAGCAQYVAEGATFVAQSEPIADLTTVEAYCEWMLGFGTEIAPGASYDLHSVSFDESTNTAVFVATFHATHTGAGGPVEATGKSTESHYVYAITMDKDDKVSHLMKIWNAPWALRELGWTD
jgi:hypothetical protein